MGCIFLRLCPNNEARGRGKETKIFSFGLKWRMAPSKNAKNENFRRDSVTAQKKYAACLLSGGRMTGPREPSPTASFPCARKLGPSERPSMEHAVVGGQKRHGWLLALLVALLLPTALAGPFRKQPFRRRGWERGSLQKSGESREAYMMSGNLHDVRRGWERGSRQIRESMPQRHQRPALLMQEHPAKRRSARSFLPIAGTAVSGPPYAPDGKLKSSIPLRCNGEV